MLDNKSYAHIPSCKADPKDRPRLDPTIPQTPDDTAHEAALVDKQDSIA